MSEVDVVRGVLEGWPQVRLAYVFGSVARGEARPGSDLDVAVLSDALEVARPDLEEALERATGRTVQIVDLRTASPLLLREVVSEGRLAACRDETERDLFELRALKEFMDTQHLRDIQVAYLRERASERRAGKA